MAIYHDSPEAEKHGKSEIKDINSAVTDHNAGALQKILAEVNKHGSMDLDGPRAVYNQLPLESQKAIKPLDADGKEHGFFPTHLEVSDVWAKAPEKK